MKPRCELEVWRGWCCWTCVASSRPTSPSRVLPRRVEPLSAVHCLVFNDSLTFVTTCTRPCSVCATRVFSFWRPCIHNISVTKHAAASRAREAEELLNASCFIARGNPAGAASHAVFEGWYSLRLARGGRVLIGDEMGFGKALQALPIAGQCQSEWPAFVVAPSALRWSHRARESSVMVRSRDGCSMHIASWLQWWSMLYLTKPWLDDVQVRRFLVSRTRLRGDRF